MPNRIFPLVTLSLTAAALLGTSRGSVPDSATRPSADSLTQGNIVAILDAANTAEIDLADLAARTAKAASVREFAQRVATEHRALQQKTRDLAAQLKITPALPPGRPDHGRPARGPRQPPDPDRGRLRPGLSGPGGESSSGDDRCGEGRLLPAAGSPELKALLEQAAAGMEGHLSAAKDLQKQVGNTSSR